MKTLLGSNIVSLRAQRELDKSTSELAQIFERLSSGLRITRASDDPAGLAISEKLRGDTRVLSQAIRNVNDGISLINIVDSALQALTEIVTRQEELALQASTGSLTFSQRSVLHDEANALVEEYNRIVTNVEFNGIDLLSKPNTAISIQAGYGELNTLNFRIGEHSSTTVGTGTFGNETQPTGDTFAQDIHLRDFNNDGHLDVITGSNGSIDVSLGNGDGTFKAVQRYNTTQSVNLRLEFGDFNGDGITDVVASDYGSATGSASVYLGNSNGTFKAVSTYSVGSTGQTNISVGDLNHDGTEDLIVSDEGSNNVFVLLGNSNGTFNSASAFSDTNLHAGNIVADFDRDGNLDIAMNGPNDGLGIMLGNGDGTFQAAVSYSGSITNDMEAVDVNRDGILDLIEARYFQNGVSVYIGNGDGSFAAPVLFTSGSQVSHVAYGDLNGDGLLDIVASNNGGPSVGVLIGNGDGTFSAVTTLTTSQQPRGVSIGDINEDGVNDIVAGHFSAATTFGLFIGNTEQTNVEKALYLLDQNRALSEIEYLKTLREGLTAERGAIGAFQSRLAHTLSHLTSTVNEYAEARSRITDADIALETAHLVKLQVSQKAATAVLAQANLQANFVLQLLR